MLIVTFALAVLAFSLGACPFSLWLGRWVLQRDIRQYGDGNPGATNVFRAGGRFVGGLAVVLDMAKGAPFVVLAHRVYGLPEQSVLLIGMCAILGSAFTPFLGFRGGKSLAVSGGVLLAVPDHDIFLVAILLMTVGFLFLDRAAWIVMFSAAGTLTYLVAIARSLAQVWFMAGLLLLLAWRHRGDLHHGPGIINRPARWLRAVHGDA